MKRALLLSFLFLVALRVRTGAPEAPPNVRRSAKPVPAVDVPLDLPADVPLSADEPIADRVVESVEREVESACPAPLRWLLNSQNPDGSWGDGVTSLDGVLIGKPGLTGLALLSFLGVGYSHLSKDRYDGLCMGDVVRDGLRLLQDDQREDGLFRSARSALDHALAALALSEAYGLTGSNAFKDHAQASVDALLSLQLRDGSWGDGPTTTWAADVLKSAELGQLAFPRSAYDGLRAYYDRRGAPDAREMIARIFMDKNRADPLHANVAAMLVASPPTSGRSLVDLYFETRALFQYDGPDGPSFKAWAEPFKRTVREREALQGPRGSDRVIHASLTALCWTIYYR
ncbi:MAG TPA: prenyltransferase/squalene oxidase repeat-containing protein [Planctomycetota bacterium]